MEGGTAVGWHPPPHLPGHRSRRPARPRDGPPAGRRAAPRRYLLSSGNWSSSAILNEPRRFFKGCPPRCIVGRRLAAREVRMRSSRPAAPAPARPPRLRPSLPRRGALRGWAAPPPGAGLRGGQGRPRREAPEGRARGARRQPGSPARRRSLPARGPRCGCGNCRLFLFPGGEREGGPDGRAGERTGPGCPGGCARRGLCPK